MNSGSFPSQEILSEGSGTRRPVKAPFSSKALWTIPLILSQGTTCGSEVIGASLKKLDLDIYLSSHSDDPAASVDA